MCVLTSQRHGFRSRGIVGYIFSYLPPRPCTVTHPCGPIRCAWKRKISPPEAYVTVWWIETPVFTPRGGSPRATHKRPRGVGAAIQPLHAPGSPNRAAYQPLRAPGHPGSQQQEIVPEGTHARRDIICLHDWEKVRATHMHTCTRTRIRTRARTRAHTSTRRVCRPSFHYW